jgi:protein-tyrosine phosphatase
MEHLEWESCYNVRDIGGYRTEAGRVTSTHAIIRADNLCRLTPAGRSALIDYGVRTVIDLRFKEEIEQQPNPFADAATYDHTIDYLHLPLQSTTPEARAALKEVKSIQQGYRTALDHEMPQFAGVMRAIAKAPEGAVLVHCHAGRDRTGLVIALLLDLVGVPAETIAEDYALSDERLKPLKAEFMQNMRDDQERERFRRELAIAPQTMRGFLSYLHTRYGGAAGYLRAVGLTEDELHKIRARLVE